MSYYLTMAAAVVFWFIAGMIFLHGDGAWKFTAVTPLFLGCVAAVRYYYLLSQYNQKPEAGSAESYMNAKIRYGDEFAGAPGAGDL